MSEFHGKTHSSTYQSWGCMIQRCTNKKHLNYKDYGGRGITICEKWLTFSGFYEDMGDRPEGTSLDRKDNEKGYCKDNCRWLSQKEQSNNTRANVRITFNGETLTVSQRAEKTGIKRGTLNNRLFRGKWPLELALNPVLRKGIRF